MHSKKATPEEIKQELINAGFTRQADAVYVLQSVSVRVLDDSTYRVHIDAGGAEVVFTAIPPHARTYIYKKNTNE